MANADEIAALRRRIDDVERRLDELAERPDYPTNPEFAELAEELDALQIRLLQLLAADPAEARRLPG